MMVAPSSCAKLSLWLKGLLINLRLASGDVKTLRLRRINQLTLHVFRFANIYWQKTLLGLIM
jgi:hypothetical protein